MKSKQNGTSGVELEQPKPAMSAKTVLLKIIGGRETGIGLVVLVLVLFLTFATKNFATADNLAIVARQVSLVAILAMGMTLVILIGGIDLSVGSVVVITAVLIGKAMVELALPIWLSILIGLGIGALAGLINGLLITKTGVPPFIITLGMMGLARGAALVITKGNSISGFPKAYLEIGQGYLGPVPYPVIIALVLAVIIHIMLTYTTFGRRIYLVGSNEEAALLSGISVNKIKVMVFTLCSTLAATEAIIETARFSTAMGNAGTGYELTAIGSVIIGGASMNGGEGTIIGTLLGATLLGLINNGLVQLGVSTYWQQVFSGSIIILAVALDTWRRKNSK
jgi:ribose/xylose/arabinose/galactoside ABC-type transport system permease subunit